MFQTCQNKNNLAVTLDAALVAKPAAMTVAILAVEAVVEAEMAAEAMKDQNPSKCFPTAEVLSARKSGATY